MNTEIRVRFAPSPTGLIHIGNCRTALFNWLFARRHKGKFLLRIEDTDRTRSNIEYEKSIIKDLKWLGLIWDEGPETGGQFAPYRQSEREGIYLKWADYLISRGLVYQCFCTPEELEIRREKSLSKGETPRYDNRCRNLSPEQKEIFLNEGRKPALRFKVPEKMIEINDLVRGKVTFDTSRMGDFVVIKSDGRASFNFAVVVDDGLMKISHVIRGEDHLSNTPRHILLFEALGFKLPSFVHMSMTLGPDGNRLSKREGATAIRHFREAGYLPEALVNYLALLGWSPPDEKEFKTPEELINLFSLERLTKAAAIFDNRKLDWLNNLHIRKAGLERLCELSRPFLDKAGLTVGKELLKKIVNLVRPYINNLSELPAHVRYFLIAEELEDEAREIVFNPTGQLVLKEIKENLSILAELSQETLKSVFIKLQNELKLSGKTFYQPIRLALTGRFHGIELMEFIPVLGKEETIKRISHCLRVKAQSKI